MIGIQESSSLPIDSGDPVLQIRMSVAALAGEDRTGWTGSALSERVSEMLEIRERFDAELLRLIGSWDRDRAWEIDGSLSPRAWLTHRAARFHTQLVKQACLASTPDSQPIAEKPNPVLP